LADTCFFTATLSGQSFCKCSPHQRNLQFAPENRLLHTVGDLAIVAFDKDLEHSLFWASFKITIPEQVEIHEANCCDFSSSIVELRTVQDRRLDFVSFQFEMNQ
jgi:hypothetical protein